MSKSSGPLRPKKLSSQPVPQRGPPRGPPPPHLLEAKKAELELQQQKEKTQQAELDAKMKDLEMQQQKEKTQQAEHDAMKAVLEAKKAGLDAEEANAARQVAEDALFQSP